MSKQKRASLSPPKLSAAVRVLQPAAGEVFKDHYVFEIFHGDTLLNEWELMREPNPAHKPSVDTGIPVCILVLKRCKKDDDVLFIGGAFHKGLFDLSYLRESSLVVVFLIFMTSNRFIRASMRVLKILMKKNKKSNKIIK